MKKAFAILLALVMVLSLGVPVFAIEGEDSGSETTTEIPYYTDATGEGSITITNATHDKTYAAYKIFDASIKYKKDPATGLETDEIEGVAYTIETDNQFFAYLFGADGTTENKYFTYNPSNDSVNKKEVNDGELIKYLAELVADKTKGFKAICQPITATAKEIEFENIPYGYYLITSTMGATVTINSSAPSVEVIDKNQIPGDMDKKVQIGEDADGNPIWSDNPNSAGIGDKVSYQLLFNATNYNGDKLIKYYQLFDEKGDALWAEFCSFRVKVDGVELPRGYYLNMGGYNTNNWELLGNMTHNEGWDSLPEEDRTANNAQWYLVHTGYDTFRITIPWLTNHEITGTAGNYSLEFGEGATSKFTSPVQIEITYDAAIEPTASIGSTTHGNRFNKAYGSWTSEHETESSDVDEVVTYVYGIGLLKDDTATGENLQGAKFKLYEYNEENGKYDVPVYVIPTGIDGVYIVDSLGSDLEDFSGNHKVLSRDYYSILRDKDGNPIHDKNGAEIPNADLAALGNNQTNEMITPENGKIVVLGLKEGLYHMVETEAPEGYNGLTAPVVYDVNSTTARAFYVYANNEGNVADIQGANTDYAERIYNVTYEIVGNSKGVELPSTGGQGTFMLITFGAVIAIIFSVLLITNKKMSIYHD